MMKNTQVIAQVVHYLKHGKFARETAVEHQ